MPKAPDSAIERMCREYWNAYRAGFLSVGGDKSYPKWDEFTEQRAKDETRRCMRHAVETLRETWGDDFDTLFPDKPMRRKASERLQAELTAEALNRSQNNG